jgi:hypothetical protein
MRREVELVWWPRAAGRAEHVREAISWSSNNKHTRFDPAGRGANRRGQRDQERCAYRAHRRERIDTAGLELPRPPLISSCDGTIIHRCARSHAHPAPRPPFLISAAIHGDARSRSILLGSAIEFEHLCHQCRCRCDACPPQPCRWSPGCAARCRPSRSSSSVVAAGSEVHAALAVHSPRGEVTPRGPARMRAQCAGPLHLLLHVAARLPRHQRAKARARPKR